MEKVIDVRQLLSEYTLAELNQFAEDYFARLSTWDYHLAKPLGAINETPQLLINFAVVLQGLSLTPRMTVLEFGAGTCWASRFLTQLGCETIAMDVSPTALEIGRELYRRHPVIGEKPEPQFLVFDGARIDLPDQSVDRIICLDAFHHAANPTQVLFELGRVLKEGGIAGFAEPGPAHSLCPQSQYEMKNFKVVENDVDTKAIWRDARQAGFTDMKLAIFNVNPTYVALKDFDDFLDGGKQSSKLYLQETRKFLLGQRNFFLYKGKPSKSDSRLRTGLKARIEITPTVLQIREGEQIVAHARVSNDGSAVWLPSGAGLGGVHIGVHLYDREGNLVRPSFHWEALSAGQEREILPQETVEVEVKLPPLEKGNYILEFDMVSNDVCWFALNGSQLVKVPLEIF